MNGIELIAKERQEQIEKHGRTIELDVSHNGEYQLPKAAIRMLDCWGEVTDYSKPKGWSEVFWNKMIEKGYKERLIIAGALLAAEIDRIQKIEDERPKTTLKGNSPVQG